MTGLKPGRDDVPAGEDSTGEPLVRWMAEDQHAALRAARRQEPTRRRRRQGPARPRAHLALVVASGLSGMATSGSATGIPFADRLLRGGLAAAAAGAASTAPTWAVVVLSTGAAALGLTAGPVGAAAGLAALLLTVVLAVTEKIDRHLVKAAAGGLSATALLRVPGGRLGATAAATAVLVGLVVLTGMRSAPRRWRRWGRLAAVGLVGLTGVGTVLGAVAGLRARASFERSTGATGTALAAARAGDAPAAAASARLAASDLRQARTALVAWWARPAWAVPVVGAHLRAGDEVARSAGPAVEAAAGAADALRLDALRPVAGRLDLAKVAAAEPGLTRLSGALHDAQRGVRRARSSWLLAPLEQRLDRYDAQLASVTTSSDRALLAVRALPRLLGAERPTRWFIAVGNPAESRELGGCVCDYAVVTADRGAIRLERSGSVSDIGAFQAGRTLADVDLPKRFLGQRPEVYWQNLGGYPDLPTVASAARALWDQVAPGSPIDGVAYVDPHGLAALLKLTGPVAAPAPLGRLTTDNAAQLLLVDQYSRFSAQSERKDALHQAASATFTALAGAPLPGPAAVGAALGPAVQGGHLAVTSFDATGQRLFDEVGASGRLPASDGGDLASLRTTNVVENKLDAYLRRSVRYQAVVDPDAGRVTATATIELRNDATADLPDYVAGNRNGLPKGTNVLAVAWYSGLALERVEVDGRAVPSISTFERGWWTHSVNVTLPPAGGATVVIHLGGEAASTRPYRLAVAPQAGVRDDPYRVEVTGASGWSADPVPALDPGRNHDLILTFR